MTEVTIRTDNEAALQKLLEFISTVGFQVVEQKSIKSDCPPVESPAKKKAEKPEPHIQWAEEPDVMALAGIWKDKKSPSKNLESKLGAMAVVFKIHLTWQISSIKIGRHFCNASQFGPAGNETLVSA